MPSIQVNDIKIFYRVFRDGAEVSTVDPKRQTMIVLHGGPGLIDHQIEIEAWQGFSKQVQILFPDLRACGQTEDGDLSQWNLKLCAEDLYGLSQELKLQKPILAGVSAGGWVIMHYLAKYASQPKAVIFCNTEARKSSAARQEVFARVGTPEAVKAAAAFDADPTNLEKSNAFFETCVPYFSKKPFSLMTPVRTNMDVWLKSAKEWSEMDFRDSLTENVCCPVLILAGEDDPNHPLACAIETAGCIPKEYLHFEPSPGAGAPVYHDQPEIFRQQVTTFLQHLK